MTTADRVREHDDLYRARLQHLVPVQQPLVLISQIQRSGGTLLSQLFDGHPECHAHPHELSIRYLNEPARTVFDLASADRSFELVEEPRLAKRLRSGYRKPATRPGDADVDVFPFLFLAGLQRRIFDACFESGIAADRDVLDAFFTSFFNAWLDNQSLYATPKKLVTAFAPRLVRKEAAVDRLFDAYSDGFLISIVREPRAWFASARLQKERYADVEHAITRWRRTVEAALGARERYGGRVLVVMYEDLVSKTEETVTRLAEQLGLSPSPTLLIPTFNGRPIRANSSYTVEGYGILSNRTDAYREALDVDSIARVDQLAGDIYQRARAIAVGG
jgi:Sulfotransferase family